MNVWGSLVIRNTGGGGGRCLHFFLTFTAFNLRVFSSFNLLDIDRQMYWVDGTNKKIL